MKEVFKLIAHDWSRYFYAYNLKNDKKNFLLKIAILFHNPNMFFLAMFRIESYLYNNDNFLIRYFGYLLYPFYYYILYFILDVIILPKVKIGGGFYLHYRGIIIANSTIAGENLTIIGPVTIGTNFFNGKKAAKIGNNVTIGSGAKIIGEVDIGDNVIVGANAVVVKDIGSNVIVAGVPAKVIKKNDSRFFAGISSKI